jgi:hypothetical protein
MLTLTVKAAGMYSYQSTLKGLVVVRNFRDACIAFIFVPLFKTSISVYLNSFSLQSPNCTMQPVNGIRNYKVLSFKN